MCSTVVPTFFQLAKYHYWMCTTLFNPCIVNIGSFWLNISVHFLGSPPLIWDFVDLDISGGMFNLCNIVWGPFDHIPLVICNALSSIVKPLTASWTHAICLTDHSIGRSPSRLYITVVNVIVLVVFRAIKPDVLLRKTVPHTSYYCQFSKSAVKRFKIKRPVATPAQRELL